MHGIAGPWRTINPPPGAPLWARHPRVFLDILKTGEAVCPYCSAHYVFNGERPKGHH